MFLCAGCSQLPASAWDEINAAQSAYFARNFPAAIQKLDGVLYAYPHHAESAEAYYLRALCHAERSNYEQAAQDAERCIALSGDKNLKAKGHATAASALFELGDCERALPHYRAALSDLAEGPKHDQLRFNYATCLQKAGDWSKARLEFAMVYQRHPTSPLAERARQMSEFDAFYIQCGAFRDRSGAESLTRRLRAAGLDARVDTKRRGGELLHVVFVGRYVSHDKASEALRLVKSRVPDAHVVP